MCDICRFLRGTDFSVEAAALRFEITPAQVWRQICKCKQINLCDSCYVWFPIEQLDNNCWCPDCSYDSFGIDYDMLYGTI